MNGFKTAVFAELKKKCGKVVYKRREQLPLWQAKQLLNERQLPASPNQVLREINYFLGFYILMILKSFSFISSFLNYSI